jgi:membrane protease YdiL (CAAX protease family)
MTDAFRGSLKTVHRGFHSWMAAIVASFCFGLLSLPAVAAYVSQGFTTTSPIPAGSIVAVSKADQTVVELVSLSSNNPIVGVVSTVTQGVVSVNPNTSNVQVVSNGTAKILASDVNGTINPGDSLTLSPIDGVAMKATASGSLVGVARDSSDQLENRVSRQLTDNTGAIHSYNIGLLNSDVQLGQFQPTAAQGGSNVVTGLQALSSNLAGKKLTPIRAVAAFALVVIATVAAMVVLFSAVTSSIRSIGRNPLAKHAVLRSLGQVIFAVVIIIFAAFAGVYVIIGV